MNKKIKYAFFFSILILPIMVFADKPSDALTQQFAFGTVIKDILTPMLDSFDKVFTTNKGAAHKLMGPLFLALIYIGIMYELAKTYLEGNYNELPIKVCTLAFKYIAIGTFLGCIGTESEMFFFKIPAEIIAKATNQDSSVFDWSNKSTSPIKALLSISEAIYNPWDTQAAPYVKQQFVEAFKELASLLGVFSGLVWIIIAFVDLVLLLIGYLLLTLALLGVLLKAVELTVAIPVTMLFLAGKAIGVGEQYFNISMKYIIASMMDIAIVLLITQIAGKIFASLDYDTMFAMIKACLVCILYLVLLKVAPKIGTGLLSGKPGVTMKDATSIIDIASSGAGFAIGVGSVIAGAGAGAMAAKATGGNPLTGMMKGAGEAAGGKNGAMNKMKNNAIKSLS